MSLDMISTVDKIVHLARFLTQKLQREPSPEEIAAELQIPADAVRATIRLAREPLGLEDDEGGMDPFASLEGPIVSPLDVGRWFAPEDPEPRRVVVVAGPLQGYAGYALDDEGDTVRAALLVFGRPEIVALSTEDLAEAGPTHAGVRGWARQSFDRWVAAELVSYWERASNLGGSERHQAAVALRRELEDQVAPEIDAFAAAISDAMTSRADEAVEAMFSRHSEHWLRREEEASDLFSSLHTDDERWLKLDAAIASCARAAGIDHRAHCDATDGEEARKLRATLERWDEATSILEKARARTLRIRSRRA